MIKNNSEFPFLPLIRNEILEQSAFQHSIDFSMNPFAFFSVLYVSVLYHSLYVANVTKKTMRKKKLKSKPLA